MENHTFITVETDPALTLDEVCEACSISRDFLFELLAHGAIEPRGRTEDDWYFDIQHLKRIQRLLKLQQDLEINLSGAILACDLLDQINVMQARIEFLEKISKF